MMIVGQWHGKECWDFPVDRAWERYFVLIGVLHPAQSGVSEAQAASDRAEHCALIHATATAPRHRWRTEGAAFVSRATGLRPSFCWRWFEAEWGCA